jgi:hypothetical protein
MPKLDPKWAEGDCMCHQCYDEVKQERRAYEPQCIVDYNPDTAKYLVTWKGYRREEATWESDLDDCQLLIKEYKEYVKEFGDIVSKERKQLQEEERSRGRQKRDHDDSDQSTARSAPKRPRGRPRKPRCAGAACDVIVAEPGDLCPTCKHTCRACPVIVDRVTNERGMCESCATDLR